LDPVDRRVCVSGRVCEQATLPICELNSSGTVTATNTFTFTGLVSRNTSAGSTFYEFDPQGTVAERLNSGSCTISSVADASGGIANSGTVSDPFGYIAQAGYYTDRQTGLILTTFRYYDPSNGRFINRDPLGYPGGIDLYNYVQNDSESVLDPLGLWGFGVTGGVSSGVGIFAGAGGSVNVGGGYFSGGKHHKHFGGFGSAGGFAGGPGFGVTYPATPKKRRPKCGALGAYAGIGFGGFLTNATTIGKLGGPFNTVSISAGDGLAGASIDVSWCGKYRIVTGETLL
jgi:RHS repeat-associated protein